jgi:hypothetical protein
METNSHISPYSTSENDWKSKAIQRRKEAKVLKKRIKEITLSRENWKNKYLITRQESIKWKTEIEKIKKKLNEIIG